MLPDEVLDDAAMRRVYGDFYLRSAKRVIEPSRVPPELWDLIPYASFWGESDDEFLAELVDQAPAHVRDNLDAAVQPYLPSLMRWLTAGARSKTSPEYIAFSCLLMAFHRPR